MPYATADDLITAFGLDEVIAITDREGDGMVDGAVALEALTRASSEADSYIAARYALPLSSVPEALLSAVCDMARYRLTGGVASQTDVIAERYRAAIAWLRDISTGRAVLPDAMENGDVTDGVFISSGRRDWLDMGCDHV